MFWCESESGLDEAGEFDTAAAWMPGADLILPWAAEELSFPLCDNPRPEQRQPLLQPPTLLAHSAAASSITVSTAFPNLPNY